MMPRRLLAPAIVPALALVASLGLAGCGHTETSAAMLRAREPPTGHTVELYVVDQPPPARPFYEIAIVQAVGFGTEATPEGVTRALAAEAGSLGCDAAVRVSIDIGYSRAHAAGVCVRYLVSTAGQTWAPAPDPRLPPAPDKNPPPPPVRPSPAPRIEPLPSSPNQGR